jgi:predicted NAD/FAD-binding protein
VRIAIVGTGISGLAAAWLLDRHHDVHVFEREPRLGGHTHTVVVAGRDAATSGHNRTHPERPTGLPVDTGFIVYNEPTYPNLTRLFDELGVATEPSDMSWSLRCERCDLEYAGSARGLVAQPGNLRRPSYLRFVADIARFNRLGERLAGDPRTRDVTIGRFLAAAGFGHDLAHHYLLPMAAAIWSTGTEGVEDFPLHTLLVFFRNHGLLGVSTHHPWRTVTGGTSSYIPRLTAGFRDRIHTGDGVAAVTRDEAGVELALASGERHRFDKVVIAAHADESLGMLTDPSADEKELLGAWDYSDNDTWLHTDTSLLPRREAARASWNYLMADCTRPGERVSLSYDMNRLQNLDGPERYVVTLNPATPPAPEHRLMRTTYTHPGYTPASVATQARLDELNGRRHTFYAGAYHRYGFHEDGLWSAIRAVSHLGIRWPASGDRVDAT